MADTSAGRLQTDLLLHAGRLLLEYNESTGEIHRALIATAKALTNEACHVAVHYGGVAISLAQKCPAVEPVKELRYNMGVQSRVHEILGQVRRGSLDAAAALNCLSRVEADAPRHSRWLAALLLGAAAASFALLLGADAGATASAGLAAALGLLARQEMGRRRFSLLALPLTAALIGSVLGGLTTRLRWTRSPELALIVPALMIVPGPHLINGLLDLIDNHVPMSLSRLWLAAGILLASALGIVIGVELTAPRPSSPGRALPPFSSISSLTWPWPGSRPAASRCSTTRPGATSGWRRWEEWRATACASSPWRRGAGWKRPRSWAA